MKKSIILTIIGTVCIAFMAKAGVPDYVICNEGVRYFEKVRYSLNSNLMGISDEGRVRYDSEDVISFSRNGRVYQRMPVIRNNEETGRYDFMELVAYRNGMKVLRERSGRISGLNSHDLVVYKDGKYVVRFDEKNSDNLSRFFFKPGLVASER